MEAISTYPSGGMFLYSADGFELMVVYDGSDTAIIQIAEVVAYTIDLDTGIVTPVEI